MRCFLPGGVAAAATLNRCDVEKAALHCPVNGTGDVAVDSEFPGLVRDERYVQNLAWYDGHDVAVVVVRHLEPMCLEVRVTYCDIHSLALLDGNYRPPVCGHTMGDAVVVTFVARNHKESPRGLHAPPREGARGRGSARTC